MTIEKVAFINLDYTIGNNAVPSAPHPEFVVKTKPLVGHTLCGLLDYTPYYKYLTLVENDPVTYEKSTREFTVYTTDDDLIDKIEPYSVDAEFVEWPLTDYSNVSTATSVAYVEYNNPCLTPTSFTATEQVNPEPNAFSGDVIFTLN